MRMTKLISAVMVLCFCGCSSGPGGSSSGGDELTLEERLGKPIPENEQQRAALQSIEPVIEAESAILADEAEIYVSKNYQYEVSLTGDDVTSDLDKTGVHERMAWGNATAFVRNLKIKCDQSIRVRIADVGTVPFIRIMCKGHCSHIIVGESAEQHAITRSESIVIDNAKIDYVGRKTAQLRDRVASQKN